MKQVMEWIYFGIYLSLSFVFNTMMQTSIRCIRDHRGKLKLFTKQARHNHKFLGPCELKAPLYIYMSTLADDCQVNMLTKPHLK